MGRASRPRPVRLAEKLLQIRNALRLSQNGMIGRLGFREEITQDYISAYERGVREPPLPVLLQYARVANVLVEVLIDDELDLPAQLPPHNRSEGVRRKSAYQVKEKPGR
ncbi:MAG: helix-turn-helix domain-containing protein [Acidobacteriota bacterium]|nr:helix-turn-helix domain-containing protein [Acidobacteriota bacterium]